MQGLEFKEPVDEIIRKAQKEGLILISAGANVIRFVPPLIIQEKHVDNMAEKLEQCLIFWFLQKFFRYFKKFVTFFLIFFSFLYWFISKSVLFYMVERYRNIFKKYYYYLHWRY